ncbi:TolC family protein [Aquimarina longa]|uniref:TolC family protein n=1 Tax=Aquimarina longa TaxID=1080221 RepID=UPI0007823499|nr:TolC family protein [Aquimarina longa]
MRTYIMYFMLFGTTLLFSQQTNSETLNFKEYLGYVKKYHPIAKQAELNIAIGQANLTKSRGGFDPKVDVAYKKKSFKGKEYYDLLQSTFKIPTWYGIELKAAYEENEGLFLNPQNTVPKEGLFKAGISIPIAQGLLINDRMATLRKAKIFKEQTKASRDLLINQILYDASLAYFDWVKVYNEKEMYSQFLANAKTRFEGIKKSVLIGDKASIDTVEAKIVFQNRTLSLEQSKIKLMKQSLILSNFLWLENNTPIELQSNVIPDHIVEEDIDIVLEIQGKSIDSFTTKNHPKLRTLMYKIKGLEVDRKLKANKLLPKINLEYNFLTETPETYSSFNTTDYIGSIGFKFPLFLRKERGDLKLAKYKLQDAKLALKTNEVTIKNKIQSIYIELESLKRQNELVTSIAGNYEALLAAEERKFSLGESSLFLINSREKKLIDAKLKAIKMKNTFFTIKAKLFNSLALNPENI